MVQDSRVRVGKYIDKLQAYSKVVVCGAGINAKRLLKYLEKNDNLTWNKEDVLRFNTSGGGASAIDDFGEDVIRVKKIDDVVGDEGCTFIKMDIEGSELKALEGAKETIKKFHPRLAISIYHRPEDIFEIPL